MKVLVTGAAGSVGAALTDRLEQLGHDVTATDVATMDVTDPQRVRRVLARKRPNVVYHLAGAKHAPDGERDPLHVVRVNTIGTQNVLEHAGGARVIVASTCKACDPETAYGASKLVAERLVLNAGGTVIRFYNIPEAAGNVFRLWEQLPAEAPVPWTDCWRFFVPMNRALDLAVAALELPPGRYTPLAGEARHMRDLAASLYPGRPLVEVPRRRGDRIREPLLARCETGRQVGAFVHVTNPHDPATAAATFAAA